MKYEMKNPIPLLATLIVDPQVQIYDFVFDK